MLRHHAFALLASLLFLQCFGLLGALQLNGVGGLTHTSIYETWARDYRFVRDDIDLVYQGMNDTDAMTAYTAGLADFWSTDQAITADDLPEIDQVIQFPVFAQALVMGYSVPAIAGDPDLVLDRETISRIWTGAITMWNDSAIQALNPAVAARLPAEPITLGYGPDHRLAIMSVARAALSSFSQEFRTAIAEANGSFALMAPAREGRAFDAGYSSALRIEWMQTHPNCLVFLRYATAVDGGARFVRMINKAGRLVEANTTSVQAAMAAHATQFAEGNVVGDITDAEGLAAWPFAYMNFVAVWRNWTTFDCTNSQELLGFLAWMLTNDEASQVVKDISFVPLDLSVRKSVLELLNQVQCNGEEAFGKAYLIGTGPSLSVYTSWAVASGDEQKGTTIKFYLSNSLQAKNRMATNSVDFGATSNGLSEEWYASIEGLALTPAVVYAFAPGYNVPEVNNMTLVLDFETIASIYLDEITVWNDPRIQAINSPEVAAALPAQPITVITQSISSAITQLLTEMLSATVPRFAAAVGAGALVDFPVENATNRSVATADLEGVIPILSSRPYTFTFWDYQDLTLMRGVSTAMIINPAGRAVSPTIEALQSALHDYADTHTNPQYAGILLGASEGSWPLATFGSFFYRQYEAGGDCSKARALAGFLSWSQTNELAKKIAHRQKFALATEDAQIMRRFLAQMKNLTCDGVPVSDLYNCIDANFDICSGAGVCMLNACVCDRGRSGRYCECFLPGPPSGSDSISSKVAGGAVAIGLVLLCLLCAFIAALVVATRRRRRLDNDWEIDFDEVEIGPLLGAGGYGQVHKAMWKGTEVAVKMMASEKVTKDTEKSFKDEVRVMTALRHPNVVLFMAASTKPPKMCIVMEFMALGSLFDLLHNKLIGDIEFALKGKMAYQAAKGMHFLHSSGIVHRDLKSLNLLLDAKWNVKVSDFGLTKFKADLDRHQNNNRGSGARDALGSVHWMAPEVLAESPDVDFALADVYSFGVILWELLTRREPYQGMTPTAVAVAVIRNDARPTTFQRTDDGDDGDEGDEGDDAPEEYRELMTSCWDSNPALRPTFLEVMTRLSALHEVGSLRSSLLGTTPSSPTTPGRLSSDGSDDRDSADLSDSGLDSPARFGTGLGLGKTSASSSLPLPQSQSQSPPVGDVTIVCTDISRAASLWELDAEAMRDATLLHNHILRAALERHRGYEAVGCGGGGEGSFCVAFQRAADALAWCADVQLALLKVGWPEALLAHPDAGRVVFGADDPGPGQRERQVVVFRGLRVRMGLHAGAPKVVRDPMTRRVDYAGPVVDAAACLTAMAYGGQVVLSRAVYDQLGSDAKARTQRLGKHLVGRSTKEMALYEFKVEELEGRHFAGLQSDEAAGEELTDGRGRRRHSGSKTTHSEEEAATCLASANLCRWIIDWHEVQVGKQIGLGSYGVVYRGKWKGVDVAVKRFIKQKLDERRMLEFRAEMAFLSELHHPNIVLFIGACVKKPNLCIVTEFVKQGSLKDVLANNAIKLTWKRKLQLLHGAAVGVNYLHSLHPVIVHRDLKPSNLLVDENMNVKVADFGFARIKEENATMTRCGTPCWTAPEILRGEKYDERADVFSFGVIMWQVATRKEPYAGRNFMGVSLDVLEGKRPHPTPADLPPDFIKAMTRCWRAEPDKRPSMSSVVDMLADLLGHDPLAHAT